MDEQAELSRRSEDSGKAPPPSSSPLDAAANALTSLWEKDITFINQRGRTDSKVALEQLSVGHELLVAAFGRGERPQLQLELEQLRQELDAAQRQVRERVSVSLAPAHEFWQR
jgi:hypothetical protein